MSELLIAVVREGNVSEVLDALVQAGHRATAFQTLGGFLREENRTVMLAVEEEQRQQVIEIFARICHGEEVEVPLVVIGRLADWRASTVHHGGATIFIVPLADIVRT